MNGNVSLKTTGSRARRSRALCCISTRSVWFRGLVLATLLTDWLAAQETVAAAPSFRSEILPILSQNCFRCHGPDEATRKGGIRLDLKENALASKDGVAIITPGDSSRSELIRRVESRDPDEQMPPPDSNLTLSSLERSLLTAWIDGGAHWNRHWAFEPITNPPLPDPGKHHDGIVNPIDRFIFERLEKEAIAPSPEAPKETLIRRVTLDLTGLPPSPDEVEAFRSDDSSIAHEAVVDRLLQSPAFGERMAWDWLDAARYADSNGYQGDNERTMWPWRDWVVNAFNRNLPFDTFTVWQLAGDLLPNPTLEQRLATGFSRNHMINGEGGRIPEENRVDYVMDMMETTGTVWLGLTLNCTRCHDHKFDPLTRKDYFRFYDFFNQTPVTGGGGNPQTEPALALPTPEQTSRLAEVQAQLTSFWSSLEATETLLSPPSADNSEPKKEAGVPEKIRSLLQKKPGSRSAGDLSELEKYFEASNPQYTQQLKKTRETVEERDRIRRLIVRVMIMGDRSEPRQTFMLDKGIYDKPGEAVSADVPECLPDLEGSAPHNRLVLARWLVAPENPLTARVIVNRFWQQFFGTGLVKTPENFGAQGEFPSHPELLDWLAFDFIQSGWDVKRLCRLIVTSATYRQSSRVTPEILARDPENRLLARGSRFRMPSWMLRDQALAASGLITRELSGHPVQSYQPPGVWEEATFGNKKYQRDSGADLYRRSIYTFWRRIVGPTLFFDSATRQTCTVKPPRTNSPLHALTTLNDVTYVEAARALAERVLLAEPESLEHRITLAFRLVLARNPTGEEQTVLIASFKRLRSEFTLAPDSAAQLLAEGDSKRFGNIDAIEHAALSGLCTAILNLDEALTKE